MTTTPLSPDLDQCARSTVRQAVAALAEMRERHPGAYEHLVREAAEYLTLDPVECEALTALAPGRDDSRELTADVLAVLSVGTPARRAASYREVHAATLDPGVPLCDLMDLADSYASGALWDTLRAVQRIDPARFRERLHGAALLIGLTKIRDALTAGCDHAAS